MESNHPRTPLQDAALPLSYSGFRQAFSSVCVFAQLRNLERTAGIEPASRRWQRRNLPLRYVRMVGNQWIEHCTPEGAGFTAPLSHQTWRYP